MSRLDDAEPLGDRRMAGASLMDEFPVFQESWCIAARAADGIVRAFFHGRDGNEGGTMKDKKRKSLIYKVGRVAHLDGEGVGGLLFAAVRKNACACDPDGDTVGASFV
ncbi:MAG: hypothetical protein LBO79_06860, partial [Zoogloeaceae bacterium]|nr:hypothetical protein [Zoogloeaceae bacterium]